MIEAEVSKQMQQQGDGGLPDYSSNDRNSRRKFLGWMGVGVAGVFALGMMPARIFSKSVVRMRNKSTKIKAIPNELAVKRSKRK